MQTRLTIQDSVNHVASINKFCIQTLPASGQFTVLVHYLQMKHAHRVSMDNKENLTLNTSRALKLTVLMFSTLES